MHHIISPGVSFHFQFIFRYPELNFHRSSHLQRKDNKSRIDPSIQAAFTLGSFLFPPSKDDSYLPKEDLRIMKSEMRGLTQQHLQQDLNRQLRYRWRQGNFYQEASLSLIVSQ